MVLEKIKGTTECGNYPNISLVAHAGRVLVKVISGHKSVYSENEGVLPDGKYGFPG